ncbi:MAG: ABC transporter permease [Acetobacteraceae bacterium]|nr:ABC transporter permease [Acetobacteraceae bacterium]
MSAGLLAPASLPELFRIQLRVIGALILRELMTRFGRQGIGFLAVFVEPILWIAAIVTLRYFFRGSFRTDLPIFVFAFVSVLPFLMFRYILMRSVGAIAANQSLLYHRRVTLLDVILARNILELAVVMAIVLAGTAVAVAYFGEWPENMFQLCVVLAMSALLANGTGLLLGAFSAVSRAAAAASRLLVLGIMITSGKFWLMQDMPPDFRDALLWHPLVSVNEALRDA